MEQPERNDIPQEPEVPEVPEVPETSEVPERPRRRERKEGNFLQSLSLKHIIIALAVVLVILIVLAVSCSRQSDGNDSTGTTQNSTTEATMYLELLGDEIITLEFGQTYEDPGTRVLYENQVVETAISVTMPQMNALGSYTVVYTATYEGFSDTVQRTVNVVDTTAPVITLLEIPGYCPEIGETYEEEGFTAMDAHDGDLTDRVERTVDGDVITYTVTDASGNTATVTRDIVYGDNVAPVITLLGDTEITIIAGTDFEDPGYTAVDGVDGDLTAQVEVTGSYEKYLPGSYTFTYTVTDAHGNTATAERTIIVQGLVQPETVTPEGKVIYLTFDDGPSSYTLDLLEVLEKYNIKATFFVVGTAGMGYVDEIAAGGHSIGIHSYTHDFYDIYASEEAFFDDFFKLHDEIYRRTGIKTTLCRFPGGSSNTISRFNPGIMTRLTTAVEAMGFQYFDWNVDSDDAGRASTADEVFENVTRGVSKRDVSIVLQHDIKRFSVEAVERIIQWALANGYTFLPLDATSPTCHHPINN